MSETSNAMETHYFNVPTASISIDLGAGYDSITITGSMDLKTADLFIDAESIRVENAQIKTSGDITLIADDSDIPIFGPLDEFIVDAFAEVTIDSSTLEATNIQLIATSFVPHLPGRIGT